jgi:hypothetical protein
MLIDEVQSFARDFINFKQFRTSARKEKIREAYKNLTGESIKISCNTCYIEALLTIINSQTMATRNYELKKGVLLEAFGDASKTCTNDTITDEIGDWYMANYPDKIIYFDRVRVAPSVVKPKVTIIPPTEQPVQEIAESLIESVIEPKVKRPKAKK